MTQRLKIVTDVIRNLKYLVTGLRLKIKFNDTVGMVAKDGSGLGYNAQYVGNRAENQLWTGDSVVIDGDYFTVPAAPFNFAGDFTLACWVKTDSTDFTIFSGERNGSVALEITNKRVTIDDISYTYAI